jgi:predicted HD phosphohydrolase
MIDDIVRLYETRGASQYGAEAVSQLEHALQCAGLAQEVGAHPELVAAGLLHDFGHLVAVRREEVEDVDDVHQYVALRFLRALFPDAVLAPIGLHVDAKRYLCHVEPGYRDSLSPASRRSLERQGGVFDAVQADSEARGARVCRPCEFRATRDGEVDVRWRLCQPWRRESNR